MYPSYLPSVLFFFQCTSPRSPNSGSLSVLSALHWQPECVKRVVGAARKSPNEPLVYHTGIKFPFISVYHRPIPDNDLLRSGYPGVLLTPQSNKTEEGSELARGRRENAGLRLGPHEQEKRILTLKHSPRATWP